MHRKPGRDAATASGGTLHADGDGGPRPVGCGEPTTVGDGTPTIEGDQPIGC